MEARFGIVCLVIMLLVVIVSNIINARLKKQVRENATASTKGQITDVKFCEGDRARDSFYYWKVVYTVGGVNYTLRSEDSGMSKAEMTTHLGETVDVYYVPDHPGHAYATVCGVTAWRGAAPF